MSEPTEPTVPGRDRTLDQLPEANERRDSRLPSARLRQIVAALAALFDGWIAHSAGATPTKVVLSALFMGTFVLWGLNLIHRLRVKDHPPIADPDKRNPSLPPPRGGWANPSTSQKFQRRVSSAWTDLTRTRRRP